MNKKIAFFSAIAIVATPFAPALAVMDPATAGPTPGNRGEMRAQRQANQEEINTNRQASQDLRQQNQDMRQQNQDLRQQQNQEKRLEFQDRKEKMDESRCKNIETRITNRINRYENNKQMLEKVYGNMQERLTRLLEKLKSSGADTSQLEKDLAVLDEKIAKLKTDHETFMGTLVASRSFVCGNSEGEFKGKIEEARKVPEIIRQDRQDIRNFFQTTIRADLQAIRATLADQKGETEEKDAPKPTPAIEPAPTPSPTPELLP